MADLEQMFSALQKADAAGNVDDAREIAAMIRQFQAQPQESQGIAGVAGDLGKLFGAGAIGSVAGAPEAIQASASGMARETAFGPTEALNLIAQPQALTNKLVGAIGLPPVFKEQEKLVPESVVKEQKAELDKALTQGKIQSLQKITEAGGEVAKRIEASISPEMKAAMAASQPTGNIIEALDTGDFSKISMGSDPSLLGLSGQFAKVFGSTAPIIATSLLTKKVTPSAVTGFGQAASEGVQDAREHISKMSDAELSKNSEYFRNLIVLGYDPKTARAMTEDKAADTAALYQGTVGALGGAFTGSLVTGKLDKALLSGARNKATRILQGTAAGATEEGLQELAEGLATDLAIDKTVARQMGADSFANAVLGAIGGGGPGGVRGAIAPSAQAAVAPEVAPPAAPVAPVTAPPSASQDTAAMLAEVERLSKPAEPIEAEPAVAPQATTVAPAATPDIQTELKDLYKERNKISKAGDNLVPWLKKYGIKPTEKADMGIEKGDRKIPVGIFKSKGYSLDELARAAVNDGIITEADLAEGVGGVESFRNLVYDALQGNVARTPVNMENMAKLDAITSRIEQLESRPEEAATEEPATEDVTPITVDDVEADMARKAEEARAAMPPPTGALDEDIPFAKAVAPTEEQKQATEMAADVLRNDGRETQIVYQDGDVALAKTRKKNGDVIYVPFKGNRYATLPSDVSTDLGKRHMNSLGLTQAQQQEFIDIRNKLEKAEEEKHAKEPFLKMQKGVSGSAGVNKNIVNIARNFTKMLGIKGDIHIMTVEEARANKDRFTGPHRPIGYMGTKVEFGAVRRLDDGSYAVVLTPSTSISRTIETLSHELGHIHEKQVFDNADVKTKNEIIREFNKWFNSQKGKSVKELVESLRPKTTAQQTIFADPMAAADRIDGSYWKSFSEWYADQVARWSVSSAKPLTVVDKFFKKLADALKKFYQTAKGQKYLPSATMKDFLDGIARQSQMDEIADRSNKGQMALFSKAILEDDKTSNKEFDKWFDGSKVVTSNDLPQAMYHGTAEDIFNVFKKEKIRPIDYDVPFNGFWFSSDRFTSPAMRDAKNVIPVFLSIKNPAPSDIWKKVAQQVYSDAKLRDGARSENDEVRYRLQDMGYDGIHYSGMPKINQNQFDKDGYTSFKDLSGKWYTISKNDDVGGVDLYAGKSTKKPSAETEEHITGYLDLDDFLNTFDDEVWVAFEPNQIKSATENIGTYSTEDEDIRFSKSQVAPTPPKGPRNIQGEVVSPVWNSPEVSKTDDLIYKLQDKHIDTKRVIQAIEKEAGKLEDQWNVYQKEELYHGRTSAALRKFLLQDLMPIIKQMSKMGISPSDMKEFLHYRHAKERNDQIAKIRPATLPDGSPNPAAMTDGGSGLTYEQVDKYVQNLDLNKAKKMYEIAKKFDAIIKGTQDILVKSGAETPETIEAWNKTYKNYVPLFREDDDFATHPSQGTGKGFSSSGPDSKRAMGSTKGVQDILGNILAQRERALIKAEKIRVGRALMGLAIKNPNPKFWLPVNPNAIKDDTALAAELDSMGLDGKDIAGMMQEIKKPELVTDPKTGLQTVRYKVNPLERYKDNVFPVRVNGKDWYIFFNQNDPRAKRMVEAMKNLDTEQLGAVLGMFGKFTRWFSAVNTQYNPVFGGINLLRDVQGAAINLSTTKIAGEQAKVLADVMPSMRTIFSTLRAEQAGKPVPKTDDAKLWEQFKEDGGQTLYRDSLTRKAEEKQLIDHELERMKRSPFRKAFTASVQLLSDFNDTIENAVRFSAYKAALDKGISREQAASIAKNLTVNFDRKGQLGSRINALYAFFNAAVQGSARLYETMKGPAGRKILAGGITLGAIQAIALALAGFDEDEPPEFIKERNLIIPLGDKKYAMIPMPLGLHFFPNIGRITTEWAINDFKNPGKHVSNLFGTAMDAFNPLGSSGLSMQTLAPSVADPFIALEANKDAFGRPIYKADRATNPTPGYLRSREGATEISKMIAEALNYMSGGTKYQKGAISPTGDQIDYLAGQFTGGVGREIMKTEQAVESSITGEELPPYRVPIAGRFIGDAESKAADAQRFYENVTKMADFENEIKGRAKNRENVAEFMRDNPQARLWPMANTVENEISQLNKTRKELLDKGAPKERIQRIEDQKQKIMRRFNDRVKALEP